MITLLLAFSLTIDFPKIDYKLFKVSQDAQCLLKETSRDRTPEQNKKVGGSKKSLHLQKNKAVDVVPICEIDYLKLANIAKKYFNGVIIYPDHIHLDLREVPYFQDNRETLKKK